MAIGDDKESKQPVNESVSGSDASQNESASDAGSLAGVGEPRDTSSERRPSPLVLESDSSPDELPDEVVSQDEEDADTVADDEATAPATENDAEASDKEADPKASETAAEPDTDASEEPEGKRRQTIVRASLLLVLLVVVAFFAMKFLMDGDDASATAHRNVCAIGPAATATGPLEIEIAEPVELDGASLDIIRAFRGEAVTKYPDLLVGEYTPSDALVGDLGDSKPWWGTRGYYVAGPGPLAADGVSLASFDLVNPFNLISVRIPSTVGWEDYGISPAGETEQGLAEIDAAIMPYPKRLVWWPEARRAEVTYDYRNFRRGFDAMVDRVGREGKANSVPRFPTGIAFCALNARDLGFDYIRLLVAQTGQGAIGFASKTTGVQGKLPPAPWPLRVAEFEGDGAEGGGLEADKPDEAKEGASEAEGDGEDNDGDEGDGAAEEEPPADVAEADEERSLSMVRVRQKLRESSGCGLEGGCNELGPDQDSLTEGFEVVALPVKITFALWRDAPEDPDTEEPDLTYVLLLL